MGMTVEKLKPGTVVIDVREAILIEGVPSWGESLKPAAVILLHETMLY